MDSQNVGRGRGGVEKALSRLRLPVDVIAIDSDCLFPLKDQEIFAASIEGAAFHVVHSDFGHDGFLLEYGQLTEILKPVLETL